MALSWPSKDPNDVIDYSIDWSRRLDAGDTISGAEFSLATAAGLSIASSSFTAATATVWLTNGTAGQTGSVRCRVTTAGGRIMDQTVSLPIVER